MRREIDKTKPFSTAELNEVMVDMRSAPIFEDSPATGYTVRVVRRTPSARPIRRRISR